MTSDNRTLKFMAWQQGWKCILCKNFLKPEKKFSNGVSCLDCHAVVVKPIESLKSGERDVSFLLKQYIAYRDEYKCQKCHNVVSLSFEIDHIVPLHNGGNNKASNLELLCANCHAKKSYLENLSVIQVGNKFVSKYFFKKR